MIDSLFKWKRVCLRQREAPLLKERERYLLVLLNQGVSKPRVRTIACILLHVIRLMELDQLRAVDRIEIQDAGRRWLTDAESHTTRRTGRTSLYLFTNTAVNWFSFHNLMTASGSGTSKLLKPPSSGSSRDHCAYTPSSGKMLLASRLELKVSLDEVCTWNAVTF